MTRQRLLELLTMLMIGKGIILALNPQWHLHVWKSGLPVHRKIVDEFAQRPALTRVLGALTVVLGIMLTMRQEPR